MKRISLFVLAILLAAVTSSADTVSPPDTTSKMRVTRIKYWRFESVVVEVVTDVDTTWAAKTDSLIEVKRGKVEKSLVTSLPDSQKESRVEKKAVAATPRPTTTTPEKSNWLENSQYSNPGVMYYKDGKEDILAVSNYCYIAESEDINGSLDRRWSMFLAPRIFGRMRSAADSVIGAGVSVGIKNRLTQRLFLMGGWGLHVTHRGEVSGNWNLLLGLSPEKGLNLGVGCVLDLNGQVYTPSLFISFGR